jgi:hypothetical protein
MRSICNHGPRLGHKTNKPSWFRINEDMGVIERYYASPLDFRRVVFHHLNRHIYMYIKPSEPTIYALQG